MQLLRRCVRITRTSTGRESGKPRLPTNYCGVLVSSTTRRRRYSISKSLSGGNIGTNAPTILDETQGMHSACGVPWVSRVILTRPKSSHLCVGSGTGASVWLSRGFVGSSSTLRPCSHRFWVRSFWIASVEPACRHPTVSPTPESSTAVFQVCCRSAILQSCRPSRLLLCLLSLSRLPSTETPYPRLSGPFRGCLNP